MLMPTFYVIQLHPKRIMIGTEVVDTANKVDSLLHPFHLASKMTTSPNKQRKAGAEGSSKPLNECSVQDPLTKQPICNLLAPLHQLPLDTHNLPSDISFDNLSQMDVRPRDKARSSSFSCVEGRAEHLLTGSDVGPQAIKAKQQRLAKGRCLDYLHYPDDEGAIPVEADNCSKPQACWDHYCHSNPKDSSLNLVSDFVHLDMDEVLWLKHKGLVESLTVLAAYAPPSVNSAGVQSEGSDYGLLWTAVAEQRDYPAEELFLMVQPVKRCGVGL